MHLRSGRLVHNLEVIATVARQNPRGVRWQFFLLFVVLLGSLESPPSIMVTRNLWSARV